MEPIKLDEADRVIIKSLLINSRKSFSEIAKECNLTTLTIKNRYNRLKKQGIIKSSTVILNLAAFGNEIFVIILIKVSGEVGLCAKRIKESLACKENVFLEEVELNERYNIVLSLGLRDYDELRKIRESIKQQPNVVNIETNLVLSQKLLPENLNLQGAE